MVGWGGRGGGRVARLVVGRLRRASCGPAAALALVGGWVGGGGGGGVVNQAAARGARPGSGNMWVTLANSDEVVAPAPERRRDQLQDPEHFLAPRGRRAADPATRRRPFPVLGPGDVAVDRPTASSGSRSRRERDRAHRPEGRDRRLSTASRCSISLQACTDAICRRPVGRSPAPRRCPPAAADEGPRRRPRQHRPLLHRAGRRRDRRAPRLAERTTLAERHFPCVCMQPLGIALDPNGDIWYSEGTSNRLGRMTLDADEPVRRGQ